MPKQKRFRIDNVALESPPGWSAGKVDQPWPNTPQVSADGTRIIVAVTDRDGHWGVGLWNLNEPDRGRLVCWYDRASAVCLLPSQRALLVVFDPLARRDEPVARLVRYSWPDLVVVDEAEAPLYTEAMVVSASERALVSWWSDGNGCTGYEVFALDGPLRQLGSDDPGHPDLSWPGMYCRPVFSPSERLVVCCPGIDFWWVPEDEDDWPATSFEAGGRIRDEAAIPSLGGRTTFATLVVHDLEQDSVTEHALQFDLVPGWVPDDGWDDRWNHGAIGLAFVTEDRVRVVLPDGVAVELTLPLPRDVLLPTPNPILPPGLPS
jgi:hypothetical protein